MLESAMPRPANPGMPMQRSTPAESTWIQRSRAPAVTTSGVQKPMTASASAARAAASARSFAGNSARPGAAACIQARRAASAAGITTFLGGVQPGRSASAVADSCSPRSAIRRVVSASGPAAAAGNGAASSQAAPSRATINRV
jgi:hypothetical protein